MEIPHNPAQSKATLLQKLSGMLEKVDRCPRDQEAKTEVVQSRCVSSAIVASFLGGVFTIMDAA